MLRTGYYQAEARLTMALESDGGSTADREVLYILNSTRVYYKRNRENITQNVMPERSNKVRIPDCTPNQRQSGCTSRCIR